MVDLLTETDNVAHPFVLLLVAEMLVHQPAHVHPVMTAREAFYCPSHVLPQYLINLAIPYLQRQLNRDILKRKCEFKDLQTFIETKRKRTEKNNTDPIT